MEQPNSGNPDIAETSQEDVTNAIFGSESDDFFADLDREVNGVVIDSETGTEDNAQVTQAPQGNPDSESISEVNYEKRYQDSSREAQKLKSQLDKVEPFMPILSQLAEDDGLVEHVKDYVVNGPNKSPEIELPEDFEFNIDEAISNSSSDSAKYFNSLMDNAVTTKVSSMLGQERQQQNQEQQKAKMESDASDFKEKMSLTDEEFSNLMDWSNDHKMTYDDLYFMKNRDKVNQNVSNATRKDMMNQMQAVRNIPTSSANVNSEKVQEDPNASVLNALKGLDQGVDNLFG